MTKQFENVICAFYRNGFTPEKISQKLNVSVEEVTSVLKSNKLLGYKKRVFKKHSDPNARLPENPEEIRVGIHHLLYVEIIVMPKAEDLAKQLGIHIHQLRKRMKKFKMNWKNELATARGNDYWQNLVAMELKENPKLSITDISKRRGVAKRFVYAGLKGEGVTFAQIQASYLPQK